jgi:hypothetical protein
VAGGRPRSDRSHAPDRSGRCRRGAEGEAAGEQRAGALRAGMRSLNGRGREGTPGGTEASAAAWRQPGVMGGSSRTCPGHLRSPGQGFARRGWRDRPTAPVRRVEIPQSGGSGRPLGRPTGWTGSSRRQCGRGCRRRGGTCSRAAMGPPEALGPPRGGASPPGRGEGTAGGRSDLEQFFDRASREADASGQERITDRRVLPRIDRSRKAGALTDGGLASTGRDTARRSPVAAAGNPALGRARQGVGGSGALGRTARMTATST